MRPSSDLTFAAGETQSNLAVVQVDGGGKVRVFSLTRADVIFDVAGWMPSGAHAMTYLTQISDTCASFARAEPHECPKATS